MKISAIVREMSFIWLGIDDEPGEHSLRGYIERNAIALLSNFRKPPLDPPSRDWLGHSADRERVRRSGLWNQNHVEESYDSAFLNTLGRLVSQVSDAG